RTRIGIIAGGIAGWLSRTLTRGQGATISGRVINKIAPNALEELAEGQRVTLVSATNGKTTTTRFLATALAADGRTVTTNSTGANLSSGIAPTLARAAGDGDAVLEVDERVLPRMVDPLGADLLVFGNLSRDQLDRYGEVHAVSESWRTTTEVHPELSVVANASDPHVVWAATPAKVTWVALGLGWRSDAATCPQCGALLQWSTDRFECPGCGLAQPETPNQLDGKTLVLDDIQIPLEISLPGKWNLANAALAVTAAAHLGVDPTEAASALGAITSVAGRYMSVPIGDGRQARVLLAKNPAGWTEVLRFLHDRDTAVVIAVNARVADGKDPSWLWD
ncbi:MAG: MurT ligase domain-containing protein, partial [Dehalococcoidia bacterium]